MERSWAEPCLISYLNNHHFNGSTQAVDILLGALAWYARHRLIKIMYRNAIPFNFQQQKSVHRLQTHTHTHPFHSTFCHFIIYSIKWVWSAWCNERAHPLPLLPPAAPHPLFNFNVVFSSSIVCNINNVIEVVLYSDQVFFALESEWSDWNKCEWQTKP